MERVQQLWHICVLRVCVALVGGGVVSVSVDSALGVGMPAPLPGLGWSSVAAVRLSTR